jgi:polysaccharide deacetylase 2 family uncharacterized protein YibQ
VFSTMQQYCLVNSHCGTKLTAPNSKLADLHQSQSLRNAIFIDSFSIWCCFRWIDEWTTLRSYVPNT